MNLSEKSLAKVWDNAAADVYNELAAMANVPQIQRELHSVNTANKR